MSETFFPVNDLLRRKFQTGSAILGLSLCAGSTVFLLLFADRLGFGITLRIEGSLTLGLSSILSNFFLFTAILVFSVGAAISSFVSFVMMGQRVKDMGLIKSAGCPSNVLFGYFFGELAIVSLVGCLSGTILGIVADFATTGLANSIGLQAAQKAPNLWLSVVVFSVFLPFALLFGSKPILGAMKVTAAEALSPKYHLGLIKEASSRVTPKSNLTFRMAVRNLSRYMSVTFRVTVCLTLVFVLMTVGIAGGIIAQQTTAKWITSALHDDAVLVAHRDMCSQFACLLSEFRGPQMLAYLNYTSEDYLIPQVMFLQLNQMQGVTEIDPRLLIMQNVSEVSGIVYDRETQSTMTVGDSRTDESLVIGIEPNSIISHWLMRGEFVKEDDLSSAVIGDSLALDIFTQPLVQSIMFSNASFHVSGVCVDPMNNGKVIYVHIRALKNLYNVSGPNTLLIELDPSSNSVDVLNRLRSTVTGLNANFEVLELREIVAKNAEFLDYIWSTAAIIPFLALAAAALCLTDYVALTMSQQKGELAMLRAIGARSRKVLKIVAAQNAIVLLSSFGTGVAIGLMLSLLFLIQRPFVSVGGMLTISLELLTILVVTFVLALYPSVKLLKKPTLALIQES